MCEQGGVVTHSLLPDLLLAFRGYCAHFPVSLELIWVSCECIILNVSGSHCFILGLVTTENIVGNAIAERLEKWALVNVGEKYRTFGENTYFYSSVTVYFCEVVVQNHLSQVI